MIPHYRTKISSVSPEAGGSCEVFWTGSYYFISRTGA